MFGLKIILCRIIRLGDADHRAIYSRLTRDGVNAWPDKVELLRGQGFDTVSERRAVNLPDWELELREAVRE
jgi:hypothetical protein